MLDDKKEVYTAVLNLIINGLPSILRKTGMYLTDNIYKF